MKYMTLIPRYRDYKSEKEVRTAFNAGKDFTVANISSRWDGLPANKEDLQSETPITVNIRYDSKTKICQVVLK